MNIRNEGISRGKETTSIPVSYFSHVSPGIGVSMARSEKFSPPFCIFTSNLWRWNTARLLLPRGDSWKADEKRKNNIKIKEKKKEGREKRSIGIPRVFAA